MITKYFKCTLLTDVVLNASLATDGNMETLDFIPGSNFLGIVAKELYKKTDTETLDIFHSEKVLFGDALISKSDKLSYTLPFSLFQEKGKDKICENQVWVHHGTNYPVKENGNTIQLKQTRTGYLNKESKFIKKAEKGFSLKSAYDREERRSAESKMFGFDAIKKGQEFIFSVVFNDSAYIDKVGKALVGTKKMGKSKTAQYGKVCIEELKTDPNIFESRKIQNKPLVIYAESRLCFLNELGNSTFQPKPCYFGIKNKDLDFAWDKCQIRIGSYSPWNAKRNSPDSQRSFIERGSVFVIETIENIDVDKLPKFVGEYQNEGFGRVIFNPEFLEFGTDGIWSFNLSEYPKANVITNKIGVTSDLGKFLKSKLEVDENELEIGQKIIEVFDSSDGKILSDNKITKSQWGNIRTIATKAINVEEIKEKLFSEKIGYLTHGVAYEKIWSKNNDRPLKALKRVIEQNRELGTQFVAKFAAEIAKKQNNNG